MFRKVLVANRGEIALRIARTCRRLGIRTVAIYSEPDLTSKHVYSMDEAYSVGPGEPLQSYLNIPKIIDVAKKAHVEAIHPGYGFLAENSDFAAAVEEAGIVFVGPRARTLRGIASKLEAKKKVSREGIPIIPGSDHELRSVELAEEEAARIGYPVLIKASYGGGGRGMRVIRKPGELKRMMEMASIEAKSGFGRPGLYVEKYLESPRHIEVQVILGTHGQSVHLGERECSMQRRYQKILEETPSPILSPEEREQLCMLGLKAAKALQYENAGTVEFVRSNSGEFYYMELNKRIQVEHLITELVTRVDIVEQQLLIASGEGLNLNQNEISPSGWAINCRINAEDPENGFAPSPGTVTKYIAPTPQWTRVDTTLYDGYTIPAYYDSLVAKLASYGLNRDTAIEWMRFALDEMVIEGVKTTIPLHRSIMDNPGFIRGDYHAQSLEGILATWTPIIKISPEEVAAAYIIAQGSPSQEPKSILASESKDRWRDAYRPRESMPRGPLFVEGS